MNQYSYMFRHAFVEPMSHAFDVPDKLLWLARPFGVHRQIHAPNVNAFDEVPNSTWFTNRNHFKSVSTDAVRTGPFQGVSPTTPWTVTSLKKSGHNIGFQIKDANGKKWLVKLDVPGYPQTGSGAGAVVCRLLWAAGYNVALDQAVTFRREDLHFETQVASTKAVSTGDAPITASEVEDILKLGARGADGRYYAEASLFLPGKPAGPPNLMTYREDDPNDWYRHKNRRDLRGLYVVYSWVNNWDVKDHQSLDMYTGKDEKPGHLDHSVLDVDGSLGAGAERCVPPASVRVVVAPGPAGVPRLAWASRSPWESGPAPSGELPGVLGLPGVPGPLGLVWPGLVGRAAGPGLAAWVAADTDG